MRVFTTILTMQWSRVRLAVILLALASFGLPAVIAGQRYIDATDAWARTQHLLDSAEYLGRLFPVLALLVGLLLGVAAWSDDQRMGHVYALSLPVSRERYVLLRFGAAGLLLMLPLAALLVGTLLATVSVTLPPGVNAYPLTLTARFGLAAITTYSVFFSLSIATRRAARLIALLLVLLVMGELLAYMLSSNGFSLIETVLNGITSWPSPFALLTGRWALFDV